MIELVFGESPAGALKMAKSMKQGDLVNGAVAVIGGTGKERHEARKPRVWTGKTMEGSSGDVMALTLTADIGDISDMDFDMDPRKRFLENLFGEYPGASNKIWETNQRTLIRLLEVKKTPEPVRIWICKSNPGELCGFYFVCRLMADAGTPLSVVRIPEEFQKNNSVVNFYSTGEIAPEEFSVFSEYEEPVSGLQQKEYAAFWDNLVQENAPLRAVINGKLMSMPEDFYDFALRANMTDGESSTGQLIGKTLGLVPGVGDLWLFLRIQAMLESGELIKVSEATEQHPYSVIVKLNSNFHDNANG